MPRYTYICTKCEKVFEARHSMREKLEKCSFIDCDGDVKKKPAIFSKRKTKDKKVGQEVKSFIEETKNEVKREKKKLKNQEYKP